MINNIKKETVEKAASFFFSFEIMGRIIVPEFTKEQRKELSWNRRAGDCPRFRIRCHSVLLKSEGKTSKEVRDITGLSYVRIIYWVKRYQEKGIDGLRTLYGENRKPKQEKKKDL